MKTAGLIFHTPETAVGRTGWRGNGVVELGCEINAPEFAEACAQALLKAIRSAKK